MLHNSMNQYFPDDQYVMLQKSSMGIGFKVQHNPLDFSIVYNPLDFNIITKKFSDMVSDFTLKLTFKKLPLEV